MSSELPTRTRILDAAAQLLAAEHSVTLSQVAEKAGVSRQALYLHFADRAELLLELGRHIDARYRTPDRQRRVDEAPNALVALEEAVRLQAFLKPHLRGVLNAVDVLRRTDEAAAAAWKERENARLQRCLVVVERLANEGYLAKSLGVTTAAKLMWAVTSQRTWEDLVIEQSLTARQYVTHITELLETMLTTQERASAR